MAQKAGQGLSIARPDRFRKSRCFIGREGGFCRNGRPRKFAIGTGSGRKTVFREQIKIHSATRIVSGSRAAGELKQT